MNIDINQEKIAIGDKYRIFINKELRYRARTELFSFLGVIQLYELKKERPSLHIEKKFSWFKLRYQIKLRDNNKVEVTTKSFWKNHFQCQCGAELYDIYGHRGRKYSVYRNNVQVAWWDKQMVSWFEGDNYHISADDDCDYELIIGFCLMIDHHSNNSKDGNAVKLDLGNFGPEAREFDTNWQPKQVPLSENSSER